jgi:hypothetical protein
MGFLRKRGPKPAEITQYTGLQLQTSSNAVPIAICYGINKLAGNLLWYGNFLATPEYTKKGGKGGGGRALSGYQYAAAIVMGVCEGPITSIGRVWRDQGVYFPSFIGLNTIKGTPAQDLSAVVSAYAPAQALAYRGVATVESFYFQLGSAATLGNMEFEVYGRLYPTAFVNTFDADPAEVIYDFLTSAQYGVGFPAESIDASTLLGPSGGDSYQAYCWAVGLGISPVLANRESANSILTRWLQLTNSAAVWSGGMLKIIPYGDATISGAWADGSAVSFVPNMTPIYDLTDDDLVGDAESDPILVERRDPYEISNVQQIEYSNRKNAYASATLSVWDQNAIELYGRRDGSAITAHEICDRAMAQIAAQLILQRGVYIRNAYAFKLSFEYCLLEPMDIVTLTDPGLGLAATPVRIVSIEEDDDGVLSVVAEELPGSTGTAPLYDVQDNDATALDRGVVPASVNPPIIFEPPASFTAGSREVWIAASGGLAPTRRLEEDGSTGEHNVSVTIDATTNQAAGTEVSFQAYILADEREAVRLRIHDGAAVQSVSFDLSAGEASGATAGVTSSSIAAVPGGDWWLVSFACAMAAAVDPVVSVVLEKPLGTVSYAGTSGEGLFVWNPAVSFAGALPSIIAIPWTASGATYDEDAQDPPLGIENAADPNWGGCIVHLSTDDATYGQIGTINGPARLGKTTASLGSAGTTLAVSLVESGGTLASASAGDASAGVTLSLVEDELLAYSAATLTGPAAYDLGGLVRGLYTTTVPSSHPSGSRFARLDDAIFKYTLPAAYVGKTLYLKFQSFNVFGLGLQDLATCATYTYTPTGAGSGASILELLSQGFDVALPSITGTAVAEPMITITDAPSDTVRLGDIA